MSNYVATFCLAAIDLGASWLKLYFLYSPWLSYYFPPRRAIEDVYVSVTNR